MIYKDSEDFGREFMGIHETLGEDSQRFARLWERIHKDLQDWERICGDSQDFGR